MSLIEQTSTGPHSGLPHGGRLVDRRLDAGEAVDLATSPLPSLPLTAAEAADLRALASGAYSPLTGFMGAKEHLSVTESMRLPDGTLWPIPVCLGVPDTVRLNADRLLLRDQAGGLLGVLDVEAVFERDRAADRTCPHSGADHVALSGTQVRAMLAAGRLPPSEFSRPEVAELLIAAYQT